jgi:DNA-binding GntR family transcriptional regulator
MPSSPLTPLQQRVAREIIALARRENRPAGSHLPKLALARAVGTSHNPVEAALAYLARRGIVRHLPDRGYFLARDARLIDAAARRLPHSGEERLYQRIVEARLDRRLPDTITEAALLRRFGASRPVLQRALARIQQEGWIERKPGHGWVFLSLIDSIEAYEDSYELRRMLEPAAVLGRKFAPVAAELAALRAEQSFMAGGGHARMSADEWIDLNARFHEALARWSGNPFLLQTLRRMNQLRRLVEFRAVAGDSRLRARQAREHLGILDAVARGDRRLAARRLRRHLDGARRDKVLPAHFRGGGRG